MFQHLFQTCIEPEPVEVKVVGFAGLVGKEPDVVRGLLIDTGASINIHGTDWFSRFCDVVLRPWNLWSTEHKVKGMKVTGVEGNSVGMDVGQTVPGNVAGISTKTGKRVNIPVTFKSQQVKGKAPALLGLPA